MLWWRFCCAHLDEIKSPASRDGTAEGSSQNSNDFRPSPEIPNQLTSAMTLLSVSTKTSTAQSLSFGNQADSLQADRRGMVDITCSSILPTKTDFDRHS
jgi:hypothetical protein